MSLAFDPTAGGSRAATPVEPDACLTIGEVARLSGATARALRYYEDAGLLTPARSLGNARRYGARTVARARRIVTLRSLGLPPEDIAPLLDGRACDAEVDWLEVQVAEAEGRLSELRALLSDLRAG